MNISQIINVTGGVIAGVLSYIFGAPDTWLIGLIILVIADYVTGLMKAYIKGELSSRVGFKGILKKLLQMQWTAASSRI